MKRTIYLIDYENVHEAGLQGMESRPAGCAIHLFYSQNANRLNLDLLRGLKASFTVHKVHPGRQSLDMQLVSYLGYLIGTEGTDCRYVIVSKDRDFANTPLFWQAEAGIEVVRQTTLDGLEPPVPASSSPRRVTRNRRAPVARPAEAPASEPAQAPAVVETPAAAESPLPIEGNDEGTAVLPSAAEAAPEQVPAPSAAEPEETRGAPSPASDPEPAPEAEAAAAADARPEPAASETAEAPKPAKTHRQKKPAGKRTKQEPAARPAVKPAPAQQDRKTRLNNRLMQVLSENQVDNATTMKAVAVTISHYSDKNIKQMTYRSIIREFGQKRGLELYNLIKPVLEADAKQS